MTLTVVFPRMSDVMADKDDVFMAAAEISVTTAAISAVIVMRRRKKENELCEFGQYSVCVNNMVHTTCCWLSFAVPTRQSSKASFDLRLRSLMTY